MTTKTNWHDAEPLRLRALMVDASELDRLIIERLLHEAWPLGRGLLLDCAQDCSEAMDMLARHPYVLILMEWNLPGYDNGDWLRAVRARGIFLPVLVVSGIPLEEIRENLDELGAAYLNKDDLTTDRAREAIIHALAALALARRDFSALATAS